MPVKEPPKREVGNRTYFRGKNIVASRLVIATLAHGSDDKAVAMIQKKYGHNSKSGAIRLALRRLAEAQSGDERADKLATEVRRESRRETEEYRKLSRSVVKIPVNLEHGDNNLLELMKERHELDSFAQVIRMAVRYFSTKE